MTAERSWPWWASAEAPPEAELEPLLERLLTAAVAGMIRRSHQTDKRRPAAGPWSIAWALEQDIWPWMLAQPARDAPDWRPVEDRLSHVASAALDGFGSSRARHLTTS